MRKNRITTTSIREIKNSFKRFISLLVISMLGVCVFVGIKMSSPDMLKSLDIYYDNNNTYDIKIISTLGLTNDDISKLNDLDGVKKAYGSYSYDTIIKNKDNDLVIKVIGITKEVNNIEILKGKLPNKNNEVVVEEAFLNKEKLSIGDEITLENNEVFNEKHLTVVGVVKSPLYISNPSSTTSRGTTNLGTGKINYYVYVNESNFNMDYYTESYILVDKAKEETTNSKEYKKLINDCLKSINEIKFDRENNRYLKLYNEAMSEILKNENEGLNKFNNAKNELDNAAFKLANGKKELDNSKILLDDTNNMLNDTSYKLEIYKKELDNTKESLDYEKEKISLSKKELEDAIKNNDLSKEALIIFYNKLKEEYIPKDIIQSAIPIEDESYDKYIFIINAIYELELNNEFVLFINDEITKEAFLNNFDITLDYYNDVINLLDNINNFNIKEKIYDYLKTNIVINKILSELYGEDESFAAIVKVSKVYQLAQDTFYEIITAITAIEKEEEKYKYVLNLYNDGLNEYNFNYEKYISYYNEYQNGLSNYNNGLIEYNNNLNLYNRNVKEYYDSKRLFEIQINDAKDKLKDIPKAKWYIYDRLDDSGYASFINDGESVTNLSKVFPSIFFIVAILISLISMSRMVEEDRSLIGTLKSLGFSNKHIRKKYVLYSGIATILGGIIGSLIGYFILPVYVWNIYKILYDVRVFAYDCDITNVIIGILISFICICGTTLITIRKIVKEKPSELLRPKAPVKGKRVLLERITFIWNKINFSNKIIIRNLSRYKKRVFMTVIGIMGCTALMLTGFGIRDSIVDITAKQYKEVFNFDEMVYLNDDVSNEKISNIFDNKEIKNYSKTNMRQANINKYSINLFIPEDVDNLENIVNLKDKNTKEKIYLENNKIIISDKLAQLINKKVGDKVLIDEDGNSYELSISGICENYVGHYVFMNKQTYEESFGKYKTNVVYLNLKNINNEDELSKKLLENDDVISIISSNSTIKSVEDMFESLNSIVFLLLGLSGTLTFVVLYNLSNINISERKREIATLKVLGFTNKEVDNYINKETIILTIFGIMFGLGLGVILNNYIMNTVEIEMVRFLRSVKSYSFVLTTIIILLFTFIVNKIIHFSLKKIDMIESLKSVE